MNKDLSTCVAYLVWWENLWYRDHQEDPGVDGIVIIKWILQKMEEMLWGEFILFRLGTSGGIFCRPS